MSNLIQLQEIKTIPAIITFDFEAVRAHVSGHLSKYENIVLTDESVKDGKELIKEINVTRKALDEARKNEAKKASEPIKAFEANMKELISLHDTLLDNLRVQIAKFEAEQKQTIHNMLNELLQSEYAEKGVRAEFRKSTIDNLVLLGSLTAGGKLTAKAQGEVKQLAANDFALQAQTDLRLSQLETACYRAGLAAPLNIGHISHFIYDNEQDYQGKLAALMSSELEREKQAIEYRKAQELRAQQPVQQQEQAAQQPAEQSVVQPQQQPTQGKQRVLVSLVFDLEIPAHITNVVITSQLDAKLKAAGFNNHTITNIQR